MIPQVLVLAGMTYAISFKIIPRFYPAQQWLPLIGSILGIMIIAVFLEKFNHTYVYPFISIWFDLEYTPPQPLTIFSITNILKHGSAVVGFSGAILLFKRWWKEKERNDELQKKNMSIKLKMLQQQLHPHFLFNTLNNLYGLILEKSDHAGDVVVKLSELLSYMLYDCKENFNPLHRELEVLKGYMLLEQLRFEDRLDLSYQINGDDTGKKIPPLLLLPFLENSFKHGVSDNLDHPWINLEINIDQEFLHLYLANSKTNDLHYKNGGIGLQNAQKRLDLIYEAAYDLKITETTDTYCVNLTIPLKGEKSTTSNHIPHHPITT
ncbi:MAG: sensor histidine kinase [Bacteroidota bacterium]